MNKLSLRIKLGVGFSALLLILLTMGVIAQLSVGRIVDCSKDMEQRAAEKELSQAIEISLLKVSSAARSFLLTGNEATLQRYEEGKTGYKENIERLTPEVQSEEGKRLLTEIQRASKQYMVTADNAIALYQAGKRKEVLEVVTNQAGPAYDQAARALDDFAAHVAAARENSRKAQAATTSTARTVVLALSVVGILVGLSAALLVVRSMTSGVSYMVAMMQELAANNLGMKDLELASQDEIGKACAALNGMKNNLRGIIQLIARAAEHVASASEEISCSATQQAQSAETQKEQTSQVASAMQEMSSTVLQVSDNSNQAAEAARQAAETARRGGAIVHETLAKMRQNAESVNGTAKKMKELGQSSDQIGRIIGVIDDIADQTNLLALNAAIEAARAGDQGRGFAVVADEVRKLAERTTTATKEIAQMIKNIQDETKTAVAAMEGGNQQVEDGVQSTTQAGDALQEIIRMAERVGDMITRIATAATQQSSATKQVNRNVEEIAALVKGSALGAQQSAKACQDLSGLALDLQKMVSTFQLESSTTEAGAGRRRMDASVRAMAAGAR